MTTTTNHFPTQYAAATDALNWATKATAPLPADLTAKLREFNPTEMAKCEATVKIIAAAIPHLTAIRDELAALACYRCSGTGEYGGASGYTRHGRKYCFTCNGTGRTA